MQSNDPPPQFVDALKVIFNEMSQKALDQSVQQHSADVKWLRKGLDEVKGNYAQKDHCASREYVWVTAFAVSTAIAGIAIAVVKLL